MTTEYQLARIRTDSEGRAFLVDKEGNDLAQAVPVKATTAMKESYYDTFTGSQVHKAMLSAARVDVSAAVVELNLDVLRLSHHQCEDRWYSCPMSDEGCADERQTECNCGALEHNAAIDAMQEKVGKK